MVSDVAHDATATGNSPSRTNANNAANPESLAAPRPWRLSWMAAAALAVVVGAIPVTHRTLYGSSDLRGFHRIWQANTVEPTLPQRKWDGDREDPDPYPPSSYILFAPLGALPLGVVAVLWYAVNLACTLLIALTVRDLLGRTALTSPWGWAATLSVLPAFIGTVLLGQNAPLLIVLVLLAYRLASRGRDLAAGALIAVAALIKVIPAVCLLPFVVRGRLRVAAGFAAAVLFVVLGLGSLLFGPQKTIEFHARWWVASVRGPEAAPRNPLDPATMRASTRLNNQSTEAVLARLTMDVPINGKKNGQRINWLSLEPETWRMASAALSMLPLLLAAAALRRMPPPSTADPARVGDDFSVVVPAMLLASPIIWSHYYVWMWIPLLVLGCRRPPGAALASAVWLAAMLLIGSRYPRAYGLPWLGTWLVFAVHVVAAARLGRPAESSATSGCSRLVEPPEETRRAA